MPPKAEDQDKIRHWPNRLTKESNVNTQNANNCFKKSTIKIFLRAQNGVFYSMSNSFSNQKC